jgi:hypothetical protein
MSLISLIFFLIFVTDVNFKVPNCVNTVNISRIV